VSKNLKTVTIATNAVTSALAAAGTTKLAAEKKNVSAYPLQAKKTAQPVRAPTALQLLQ
jgi:hypothetical protein